MGIFLVQSEDKKYHIYRLRNRSMVYFFIALVLGGLFLFFFFYKIMYNEPIALFGGIVSVLAVVIHAVDLFPARIRKNAARGLGNEVIERGNPISGPDYELKIEKKGLRI